MDRNKVKLAVCGLLLAVVAGTASAQEQGPRITVSGEGRIAAVPDMARLSLGVEAADATAAGALGLASDQMSGVMEALSAAGIEPRAVQTSTLSVRPQYEQTEERREAPVIVGYVASSDLNVKVADLDGLGALIDKVTSGGGNRLSGISFEVADPEPLMIEARQAAVKDAMAKAALFAGAADVTLGEVIEISEAGSGRPQPMAMMESAGMRSMPVAAGEIEVTANVTMVFAIGN
ncbi:SIMPL domain-containing protein [Oceaniglobus trochenteri]|uniref:SIMPL domain-containing protein n=1 Tax=Oceaniglobus trochenteri TaxID=2763260 RepID=UPI001CFFB975|nr:SIMPL domain-containing protein [Oceaniglobus trochenteri]